MKAGFTSRGRGAVGFFRLLWVKAGKDDIFFMASAVAFNIIVALIPLIILGIGLTAYVLSAQVADPVAATVSVVESMVPGSGSGADVAGIVRTVVAGALAQRSGFTFIGALFFTLLATRLIGTLRVVLREAFELGQDRGIFHGKLFDIVVVALGVVLLTLNLGLTILLEGAMRFGVRVLELGGPALGWAEWLAGHALALGSVWALFLVVYRYLPLRRVPWRTALVAATFAALGHEGLKIGFSWYATRVADYTSTWGNLATVAVLFFWIYYEALVFILGGEVAHVYSMGKAGKVLSGTVNGGVS